MSAYMPRGMAKKNPDQFDPSALLNLINYCQWFSSVDPKLVREVNTHLVTTEIKISFICHVHIYTVCRETGFIPASSFNKKEKKRTCWATRLSPTDFLSLPQDAQQLKKLGGFLQANKDLGERFSADEDEDEGRVLHQVFVLLI
uniref:Uncharacterized protein n=1 Tax=Stegastes partitus TaxID=144197 RepID=A0A3B5B570_9TELE